MLYELKHVDIGPIEFEKIFLLSMECEIKKNKRIENQVERAKPNEIYLIEPEIKMLPMAMKCGMENW